jgi:predicted O-methyltransferase YrrM
MVSKALKGLGTVNLRSLRFSSDPAQFLTYLRELDSVHQSHTIFPLRRTELPEIVGSDDCQPMFLPVGHMRSFSTPLQDLAALAALARKKCPRRVFEIGTFEGLTSVLFVRNSLSEVFVHTLDLPHDKEVQRTQRSYTTHGVGWSYKYESGRLIDVFGVRQQVRTLFGDSALFDFAPFRDQIDLFFVDGAHSEDYVALDSCHAFECLAPDGWVVWHDCLNPHVLRALKEIAQTVTVLHIRGTNLALMIGKPPAGSFTERLRKEIR